MSLEPPMPAVPILRWADGKLRTQDGAEATDAQRTKAKRYLKDGLITLFSASSQVAGWGEATWTLEVYRLEPVPGCRQLRTVHVKTWVNARGDITAIDLACDCQRASGTVSKSPGICSHALAVHFFRKDDTREA